MELIEDNGDNQSKKIIKSDQEPAIQYVIEYVHKEINEGHAIVEETHKKSKGSNVLSKLSDSVKSVARAQGQQHLPMVEQSPVAKGPLCRCSEPRLRPAFLHQRKPSPDVTAPKDQESTKACPLLSFHPYACISVISFVAHRDLCRCMCFFVLSLSLSLSLSTHTYIYIYICILVCARAYPCTWAQG